METSILKKVFTDRDYIIIKKRFLENNKLSIGAIALICKLEALPDDADPIDEEYMCKIFNIKMEELMPLLEELNKCGYLHFTKDNK